MTVRLRGEMCVEGCGRPARMGDRCSLCWLASRAYGHKCDDGVVCDGFGLNIRPCPDCFPEEWTS
jgi:hypothetical protein